VGGLYTGLAGADAVPQLVRRGSRERCRNGGCGGCGKGARRFSSKVAKDAMHSTNDAHGASEQAMDEFQTPVSDSPVRMSATGSHIESG
jgi:hypothetical protein